MFYFIYRVLWNVLIFNHNVNNLHSIKLCVYMKIRSLVIIYKCTNLIMINRLWLCNIFSSDFHSYTLCSTKWYFFIILSVYPYWIKYIILQMKEINLIFGFGDILIFKKFKIKSINKLISKLKKDEDSL